LLPSRRRLMIIAVNVRGDAGPLRGDDDVLRCH
jgi:hypothetical protein